MPLGAVGLFHCPSRDRKLQLARGRKTAEEDGRTPMQTSIKVCRPQAPESNNRLTGDLAESARVYTQTLLLQTVPAFVLLLNYYHVAPITQLRNHHGTSLIILRGSTLVRELMTVLDESGRDRCGFVRTAAAARHLLPVVIMPDVFLRYLYLYGTVCKHIACCSGTWQSVLRKNHGSNVSQDYIHFSGQTRMDQQRARITG
jgi:hypothetical protein